MDTKNEEIILWPDGVWCWREDLEEMLTCKSDDFEVIKEHTSAWHDLAFSED